MFIITLSAGIIASVVLGIIAHDFSFSEEPLFPWHVETYEKKTGEPCISFETFKSVYSVNPERWYTADPSYGHVGYRTKTWHFYGEWVYWETIADKWKYCRWYADRAHEEKVAKSEAVMKEIIQSAIRDIEKKKKEIEQNTKSELDRIEKERIKNEEFFSAII